MEWRLDRRANFVTFLFQNKIVGKVKVFGKRQKFGKFC